MNYHILKFEFSRAYLCSPAFNRTKITCDNESTDTVCTVQKSSLYMHVHCGQPCECIGAVGVLNGNMEVGQGVYTTSQVSVLQLLLLLHYRVKDRGSRQVGVCEGLEAHEMKIWCVGDSVRSC
jgi:hypothetical protein